VSRRRASLAGLTATVGGAMAWYVIAAGDDTFPAPALVAALLTAMAAGALLLGWIGGRAGPLLAAAASAAPLVVWSLGAGPSDPNDSCDPGCVSPWVIVVVAAVLAGAIAGVGAAASAAVRWRRRGGARRRA
jgi:MFS family permease